MFQNEIKITGPVREYHLQCHIKCIKYRYTMLFILLLFIHHFCTSIGTNIPKKYNTSPSVFGHELTKTCIMYIRSRD